MIIKSRHFGFSLVEFLVYCLIMTMIAMLTMDWLVSCHIRVANLGRTCTEFIALTAAHDLVMRDLAQASVDDAHWKKITETGAIWSVGEHDVGWELREGILTRSEGTYHAGSDAWATVRSYKVADTVKRLTVTHEPRSCLAACCLQGQGDGASYDVCRWVALHNGLIL